MHSGGESQSELAKNHPTFDPAVVSQREQHPVVRVIYMHQMSADSSKEAGASPSITLDCEVMMKIVCSDNTGRSLLELWRTYSLGHFYVSETLYEVSCIEGISFIEDSSH